MTNKTQLVDRFILPFSVKSGWQQHHQANYSKGFVAVRGLVMCKRVKVTFIQSFVSNTHYPVW